MNSIECAEKKEAFPALTPQRDNHHSMNFHEAAMKGDLEKVKELLVQGADIHQQNNECLTALHHAAAGGHLDIVKELLKHGANAQKQAGRGQTALHRAVENGYLEVVKELLKHGANVNQIDKYGQAALRHAASNGHLEVVKTLLKHNADVIHPSDENGDTPDQPTPTLKLARYLKLCSLEMTKEPAEPVTPVAWKTHFSLFLSYSTQLQKTSATNTYKSPMP